jgi:flagellum-specific peptidoglycan hydrolase FlgJ
MIKKSILYVFLCFCIACGSSKSVVRTTTANPKASREVVHSIKKPIIKTTENTNSNQQEHNNKTTEILEATTRIKVTTALVLDYIEKYKKIAKEDMIEYGIPASITLGQGILESGAGTGPLSEQANNHFGIKCHKEWNGPSVKYDDDEAQECFRKYTNPEESYRDHSVFLATRKYYIPLFKLDKSDYKAWAKGLKEAGYATDKAYATKLISLIERYQLQQFDAEVLGINYVPLKNDIVQQSNKSSGSNSEQYQVVKGDTLYSISKRYNITIEDLKKKNNISEASISIGQTLQIK